MYVFSGFAKHPAIQLILHAVQDLAGSGEPCECKDITNLVVLLHSHDTMGSWRQTHTH